MTEIQVIPSSQINPQYGSQSVSSHSSDFPDSKEDSNLKTTQPPKSTESNFSNNSVHSIHELQSRIIEFEVREEIERQHSSKSIVKNDKIKPDYNLDNVNAEDVSVNKEQSGKLSTDEKKQVKELKARDQEVRSHENAHLAASGGNAIGGPAFVYQTGPDGQQYAVGGHVNIDTGQEATPEETVTKMASVLAAAMAPAEPSSQDISVASKAMNKLAEARHELSVEKAEESQEESNDEEGYEEKKDSEEKRKNNGE